METVYDSRAGAMEHASHKRGGKLIGNVTLHAPETFVLDQPSI